VLAPPGPSLAVNLAARLSAHLATTAMLGGSGGGHPLSMEAAAAWAGSGGEAEGALEVLALWELSSGCVLLRSDTRV
jgi:hypothetical protein